MPTLDWIGKDKVINHHLDVPYRVLDKQYTYGADESANMIIHGDNLLALKSLLPKYEGKIDCVYIDPPYNTGNEGWIYNDNVDDPRISRLIQSYFKDDAIVLDSFAGSGTTGQAVLGLNKEFDTSRTFILIEMMDYAKTITAERVKRVIDGYGTENNRVNGTGGDFSYYELGEPLLIDNEYLNEAVGIERIREYIFFMETKEPISQSTVDDNAAYLGAKNGVGYYFNYDKDKTTTLDFAFLKSITQKFDGYIIYADKCVLSEKDLLRHNITFKKIPRDITRL